MEKRIPITPPLRGLSDNSAYSEQEPGTTRDARNMRGIDAPTGRTRLSQRAGSTKFNTTVLGASHVQDLAVVTRDSPKIEYANLASLSSANVEWSSVSAQEGTTWWPEADFQGNVVLLDGDNQLAKYNADGVLLRTTPVLAPQGGGVVRKVAVDVDGGVYVAAYAANYLSGTVWRFIESATDPLAFEEAWAYDFTNCAPVMFTQTGNTLYVAVRYGTGYVGYELWRLDGSLTGIPTVGATQECPGPVNALEVAASGALWMTAEANVNRGTGPDSQGVTRVSREDDLWTPHDLTNADERLYFWTRADDIDGSGNTTLTDGDEVALWADHRFSDSTASTVFDTTDRKWVKDSGSPARPGPRYRATGWGGYPCVQFDGNDTTAGANTLPGQALQAAGNLTNAAKATNAQTAFPGQLAFFPGWDGAEFFSVLLVRITSTSEDDGPAVLLSQSAYTAGGPPDAEGLSTGILVNAAWDTTPQWSADTALFDQETPLSNAAVALGNGLNTGGAKAAEGEFDATNGYALLTIAHAGQNIPASSVTRINGRVTDNFTITRDQAWGAAGVSIMGCRRRAQSAVANSDMYEDASGYVSFTGEVVECITVLADSSTGTAPNVHDQSVMHPGANAAPYSFNGSGEAALSGQRTSRYAVVASEVELTEGYMAHFWGVSHVLPREYKDGAVNSPFASNHPFAGTGNYPRKAGSTIDPLTADQWSPDAVLWRCSPTSLGVTQAIAGGGMGYALAADEDGNVVTLGPKSGRTGSGTHYGPDNFADETVIMRKIEDRLDGIRMAAASWGAIYFTRQFNVVATGGAADGDTVTISDGSTSVVFEFDNDATVTVPNTTVSIGAAGFTTDDPVTQIADLVTAINASALTVTARQNGPLICEIFNDAAGSNNVTISTSTAARIGVFGMFGGTASTISWTLSNGSDAPDTAGLRMAFDDNGDLWVPQLLSGSDETVTKLDGTNGTTIVEYDLDAQQEATGVALPLSHPSYLGSSPVPTGPLFMYVTSTGGELATQEDNVRKVRIISEELDLTGGTAPRATRYLGVCEGTGGDAGTSVIVEFNNLASVTVKTGGSLLVDSPYISSVVMTNKVVWTDGTQYLVYDAQTDVLEPLISTRGGSLPKNGRLLANWNGRLLISRTDDDPYVIYGSRRGEITDWDEFPVVTDYLEAFSTPNSIAGRCADIVNAMISVQDDLLLVGGDHSIFRLTGDPTGGGQFDMISDITGIAFGYPSTRDVNGAVYFFGSWGNVYRSNGEEVVPVSRDRLPRRLANIDLATYRMRMVYNHEAEEIEVIAVPYNAPTGTPPVSWALDKNGSWWEDSKASWDVAPTAVVVADGDDPDDRVLLYGCGDGYVRKWDKNARDDDGQRIDSYVYIGPIGPTNTGREAKFLRPQIALASDQQGCDVEFYASDTPELVGTLVGSARLGPGQNPRLPIRGRGTAMYVRLHNGALSERWSMEQGTVGFAPAGRTRVR